MHAKHPRESETVMAELMMPQHANIMGNVFGGVILALVDRVAAVAAIRHAGKPCVTVSVDKVDFREPIHVGELLTAYARVNFAGRTSMEVGVKIISENVLTGEKRHTNSCYVTYVALDAKGRPTAVPPIVLIADCGLWIADVTTALPIRNPKSAIRNHEGRRRVRRRWREEHRLCRSLAGAD
ncbi:MAG: acyl-CoA thioesterase [Gemmatimonadetes bacterium]|nr:MAG: acyl-CoA thioesterase [Gemmatimonadota bacterium]